MKAKTKSKSRTKAKTKTTGSVVKRPLYPINNSPHAVPMPQGDAFTAIQIVQALAADRFAVQKGRREGTEPVYAESVCNGKRWMTMDTILNPKPVTRDLGSEVKALSKISGVRGRFVVRFAKIVLGLRKLFRRK